MCSNLRRGKLSQVKQRWGFETLQSENFNSLKTLITQWVSKSLLHYPSFFSSSTNSFSNPVSSASCRGHKINQGGSQTPCLFIPHSYLVFPSESWVSCLSLCGVSSSCVYPTLLGGWRVAMGAGEWELAGGWHWEKKTKAESKATLLCTFAFNRKLLEARCLNAKKPSAYDGFRQVCEKYFVGVVGLSSNHTIKTNICFYPVRIREWPRELGAGGRGQGRDSAKEASWGMAVFVARSHRHRHTHLSLTSEWVISWNWGFSAHVWSQVH